MSLGIDLSPNLKQCNFDCLYCELAPMATTDAQTEALHVEEIINQLQQHLDDTIDVITLTANGEPTLYPYLSELIDAIDTIKGNKETLILTNSATLSQKEVFETLLKLDQVKLSLDAISSDVFKKIDRPHQSFHVENIVKSVIAFSKKFRGKLFIEILFVKGLNDSTEEIAKLNDVLLQLQNIQRVDIGTIDRPPAYPVEGINYKELYDISLHFDASLPIHIASRKDAKGSSAHYSDEEILNTLDKRPLTLDDIELLFDTDSKERLHVMLDSKQLVKKIVGNLEFIIPQENLKRKRKREVSPL